MQRDRIPSFDRPSHRRFGQGEARRRERRRSRGRTRVAIDPEEEADRSSVPTDDWRPPRNTPGVGCPIDSEGARPSSHVHYRPTDRPTDRKLMIRAATAYVRDSRLRENPKFGFATSWKEGRKEGSGGFVVLDLRAIPENAFISDRPRIILAYSLFTPARKGRGTTL